MKKCVYIGDEAVDYETAVNLMDDEIREEIHQILAPCTEQEFVNEYIIRHFNKFGDWFSVN